MPTTAAPTAIITSSAVPMNSAARDRTRVGDTAHLRSSRNHPPCAPFGDRRYGPDVRLRSNGPDTPGTFGSEDRAGASARRPAVEDLVHDGARPPRGAAVVLDE